MVTMSAVLSSGLGGQVLVYLGYGLLMFLIGLTAFIVYYFTSFNYKATIWPLHGSGTDGIFSIGKPFRNRIRWAKNRTAWRAMWPLFNRKNIEPFDSEYIYPGKQLFAFDLNGCKMPGRWNVSIEDAEISDEEKYEVKKRVLEVLQKDFNKTTVWKPAHIIVPQTESVIRSQINPVPYYVRNWGYMESREAKKEFAEQNWWEANKPFIAVVVTVIACCALTGAVIYFSFDHVSVLIGEISRYVDQASAFGVIQAKPPS